MSKVCLTLRINPDWCSLNAWLKLVVGVRRSGVVIYYGLYKKNLWLVNIPVDFQPGGYHYFYFFTVKVIISDWISKFLGWHWSMSLIISEFAVFSWPVDQLAPSILHTNSRLPHTESFNISCLWGAAHSNCKGVAATILKSSAAHHLYHFWGLVKYFVEWSRINFLGECYSKLELF